MVSKTISVVIVLLLLCVTSVSAWELFPSKYVGDVTGSWQIQSEKYSGKITLNDDWTGFAQVDGYGMTDFRWNQVDGNNYEAHYWFYTIPFTYDPQTGIITSTATNAVLVR